MDTRITKSSLVALSLIMGLCGSPPASQAADDANNREVMAYVISHWDGDCDADDRENWDNMVRAWYEDIRNDAPGPDGHGPAGYNVAFLDNDGYISDSDFVDPAIQVWGNDVNNADLPDAFMVGLHGGNNSGDHRWYGAVKFDEAGVGNCSTYQGSIRLGDEDLEFLHLSSCFSMDREDWWNEWNSSFNGLHQVEGFHGLMYIDPDYVPDYRRFADDSFWVSIADSWLDNLYDTSHSGDQCPVARVVGTDQNDCRDRLNMERYNLVFSDPPGVGENRAHRARYIRGCTPGGMEALPQ
jgi:hypothetical protein